MPFQIDSTATAKQGRLQRLPQARVRQPNNVQEEATITPPTTILYELFICNKNNGKRENQIKRDHHWAKRQLSLFLPNANETTPQIGSIDIPPSNQSTRSNTINYPIKVLSKKKDRQS